MPGQVAGCGRRTAEGKCSVPCGRCCDTTARPIDVIHRQGKHKHPVWLAGWLAGRNVSLEGGKGSKAFAGMAAWVGSFGCGSSGLQPVDLSQ